ncbi:hypothetical protein IF1G_08061 [Cordyceps javanica]|uniref:Altered inheritance of mitochondria protein 11 n=1 Tax=Cordyceps javanica TaxID=43265 RepID=A0A545UVJ2_9HYPO|nr:hypothetical protein IF1G_08061 [Cordyceps javanica]TQW05176.1 hypothetical protein IF2G_07113 [Cordyceps javanica]
MGFLAKLLAPHVVGTSPEQGSSSSSPSSSSSVSSSQTAGGSSSSSISSISAAAQPTAPPPPTIDTSSTAHLTPAQRQVKQLGLLLLGAGFMAASVGVTRRAVLRRQREAVPRFFHSSSSYLPAAGGSATTLDAGERSSLAAQALGLATLNVAGFAVLLLGGTAWSFDLCSVAELQARTQMVMRRGKSPGADGMLDEQDEKEVDNMVVALMERLGMDVDELKEKDRRAAEAAQSMTPTTATATTTTTTPKL